MPNFAQEFPLLLFMPFIIFAAVALAVGMIHLAVIATLRFRPGRYARSMFDATLKPAMAKTLDPQFAQRNITGTNLQLIARKS